jgi:(p)ppGpp synthase/HD superfamily hydrolase
MGQTLENGDQITVNTAKNQKPNENWLRMVVTGKARSKIRSALKEEQQRQGELGKEALQRKLRSLKADFEENVDMLVRHYGFNSRNDLYYAISTEQVHLLDLKKFKVEGHKLVDPFANRKPVSQAPPNQGEKGSRAEKGNRACSLTDNPPNNLTTPWPTVVIRYKAIRCLLLSLPPGPRSTGSAARMPPTWWPTTATG